jgi:hypothetical protein
MWENACVEGIAEGLRLTNVGLKPYPGVTVPK